MGETTLLWIEQQFNDFMTRKGKEIDTQGKKIEEPFWAPATELSSNFEFAKLLSEKRGEPVFWLHQDHVFQVDAKAKTIAVAKAGRNEQTASDMAKIITQTFSSFKVV